jgi:hypothetical protein
MDSLLQALTVGLVIVIFGLILEYRTKWFARALDSARGKQDSAGKVVNLTVQAPGQNSRASIQGVTTYQVEGDLVINQPGQVAGVQSAGVPAEEEYRTHPTPDEIVDHPGPVAGVQSASVPAEEEYRTHPTPEEIEEEIERLPSFQRESAAQYYVGLKVDWTVRFSGIRKTAKENICTVSAFCESDRAIPARIRFDADISKYPQFKILKEKHKLRVRGEISGMDEVVGWVAVLSNVVVKVE